MAPSPAAVDVPEGSGASADQATNAPPGRQLDRYLHHTELTYWLYKLHKGASVERLWAGTNSLKGGCLLASITATVISACDHAWDCVTVVWGGKVGVPSSAETDESTAEPS